MEKYGQLVGLANENGVIKKVLKAGGNHFAVGPDFNEVGDPENYQFQDCSDIAKNSKYNRKSLEGTQFANGMEFGKYGMSSTLAYFNSCVGFDSSCVRRQMDNFVHDLISANHDGESKNLTI